MKGSPAAKNLFWFAGLILLLCASGCGRNSTRSDTERTLCTTLPRVRTLDPAKSDDVACALAVGHLYDRLLQYDYEARPYRLVPAMLAEPPAVSTDGLTVTCRLRNDLFFAPDPCFAAPGAAVPAAAARERRRVRARDVIFSLLRLADARVHSGGFWILRGYLAGIDEFNRDTAALPPTDFTPYERGIPGLAAPDEQTVVLRLNRPYPQLFHVLAMPYASVVSERVARACDNRLDQRVGGSGPFLVEEWRRNYGFTFRRNPDFRRETVSWGHRPLPLADRVVAYVVQEPVTTWLLFLQGNLDLITLPPETVDTVVGTDGALAPELRERGIRLHRTAEYQINYIGINARDPLLGHNLALREALSLAFNVPARVDLSHRQLLPAQGPIPPGVEGYDEDFRNPFAEPSLAAARQRLTAAGFPGGVDPATGRPLHLRFDLGGTDLVYRQQAELLVKDLNGIGIDLEPILNNRPRFFDKLQRGDVQLFRVSWVGDYPDAQNFLQLFYGPNAGSCNRTCYRNPDFDRLYEQAIALPDSPERTALYRQLQAIVTRDCAWLFEGYPLTHRLVQPWIIGYIPHHFAYDAWKYLDVDPQQRTDRQRGLKPVRFQSRSHVSRQP